MESKLSLVKWLTMDEAPLNIWTLRFTITDDYIKKTNFESNYKIDQPIIDYLGTLNKTNFPKILCYREHSKGGKDHYHMRIGSLIWKTRKSLFDSIHKNFPFAKGNKVFSTKAVRVLGVTKSSLEKSITYISKDGNLVFQRGYSSENLEKFQAIGAQWTDESKLPIFKRVIMRNAITNKTTGDAVVSHVLDFYKDEGKDYPTYFNLTKILSNIKLAVDTEYRRKYLEGGARFYDDLMHNLQYN